MPLLSTPLQTSSLSPSSSTPTVFLRPPSPTSTPSSWFQAGGRESREAGERHWTAGSRGRGQGRERGLGADKVACRLYFTGADEFEMPSKKHRSVPAPLLPGKGRRGRGIGPRSDLRSLTSSWERSTGHRPLPSPQHTHTPRQVGRGVADEPIRYNPATRTCISLAPSRSAFLQRTRPESAAGAGSTARRPARPERPGCPAAEEATALPESGGWALGGRSDGRDPGRAGVGGEGRQNDSRGKGRKRCLLTDRKQGI